MRYLSLIIVLSSTLLYAQAQDSVQKTKYLEDQIYVGLTFINLTHEPESVQQNGFSSNFSIGFIKDIPINLERNLAFGIGLGYGHNTYFQNIKIFEANSNTNFVLLKDIEYKKNRFSTLTIEVPLEIRWRSSTANKHKFWRFYIGTKFSYAFLTKAKYKDDASNIKLIGIPEFNNFQYGLTLAAGYGTWNFNFYYGLSDLFSNANLDATNPLTLKDFRLGLIFYIF